MLKVGESAPEFTLPGQDGEDVSLTDRLHQGPVLLYFYPADFTSVCTKEACTIRDLHNDIMNVGIQVLGISPQDTESHKRFADKYELPFTLLSDEDKTVIKMYGVNGPLGFGVRRATYLVHPDRRIKGALLADFNILRHEGFIKKAIMLREAAI